MYNLLFVNYLIFNLLNAIRSANAINVHADIEYLHKYRVYTRRVLSLLKLFMPEEKHVISELKRVLKQTNELRDLDVLLTTIHEEKFPKLKEEIRQYRIKQYRQLWHQSVIDDITSTLLKISDALHNLPGIKSYVAMIKKTEKYFKKTMKAYQHLSYETDSDAAYHAVRIRFKISRYALEFFKNCDIIDLESQIKTCKKAQESFGNLQDISAQIEWLNRYARLHPSYECTKMIKKLNKKLAKERRHLQERV
ncbi:CHAD domain-containing protein [Sulfurospirillum sp. 1612]|uniref:CHAD domain-containing protein n=1 Tax=Sulfurospirillum sp. 1612 TaxID=3094835 RepID=UPI002F9385E1